MEPSVEDRLPRFHSSTFLMNLEEAMSSLLKAHYGLKRMTSMPITLLRIQVYDSPYASQGSLSTSTFKGLIDESMTIYVAFPDNTSYIYISHAGTLGLTKSGDGKSLREIVVDAIPGAMSRFKERYVLKPTSLSTRSLTALLALRGPGRGNVASGGWSIFAEEIVEKSPLAISLSQAPLEHGKDEEKESMSSQRCSSLEEHQNLFDQGTTQRDGVNQPARKRRRIVAQHRFAASGIDGDGKSLERLDICLEDPFPDDLVPEASAGLVSEQAEIAVQVSSSRSGRRSNLSLLAARGASDAGEDVQSDGWTPSLQLTFHGTHVFAGIRKLVESGAVDGETTPGWMTGENGVSIGVVHGGRMRGNEEVGHGYV